MKKTTPLILALLSVWGAPPVPADDSDIFTGASVQPNVVILFDDSGSMDDRIDGVRKIDTAKSVVTGVIRNVDGIRFGVLAFNEDSTGARMVAPVGTDRTTMIDAVNDLDASGNTPLGRATEDIQRYFRGQFREGRRCTDEDRRAECIPYPSPIQYECQKNYVIIMTDGLPNGEDQNLVANVATSLYSSDHSTAFSGKQNVIVHTVGFDVPDGTPLLQRTASNGGGSFYAASNAAQLEAALRNALQQVITDNYSFAMPLVPSTYATGGSKAYFASFRPSTGQPFWRGYLNAYRRDSNGNVPVGADGEPSDAALVWDAGQRLAGRASSARTILTVAGGTLQQFTRANGAITSAHLGVATASERDRVIDFVRGIDSYDDDLDGNSTEERQWKLGDIFHSNPVLVYPPPLVNVDSSYASFKQANASRATIVLTGANDGMLHAFRESDGEELWAFIPPNVLSRLKDLTPRVGTHPYYVDSTPVVADVKWGGSWKTVVLFGERRGGNQYHLLDITDTTNPGYLWAFADAELGETWSEPAIGRIQMSTGRQKHVAFVGGGYNTAANNGSGRAFFVIDLSNGQKLWQYRTGGAADAQFMNFSVPASPTAADLDADGLIDRVYVGDVGGQLWKFDVSAAATLSGGLVSNWLGKRLFVAAPSQANPPPVGEYHAPQAIYGSPALSFDTMGDLWVLVGTGDRNHPNDTSQNRFYGIKDGTDMTNGSALTESALVDATSILPVTQGWYLALAAKEKVLASANVFNNVAYFSTFTSAVAATACESARGTASLYGVHMATGRAGVDWPSRTYLPSADPATPRSKSVGGGIPSRPGVVAGPTGDSVVVGTTDEEVSTDTFPATRRKQIRYWREVY